MNQNKQWILIQEWQIQISIFMKKWSDLTIRTKQWCTLGQQFSLAKNVNIPYFKASI